MNLTDQADAVRTRKDLIRFIGALVKDLTENPDQWENPTLDLYLEAMSSWLPNIERYYENSGESVPSEVTETTLTWQLFAQILLAATMYE